MTTKRLNIAKTPIEELECDKKYVYDTGIIFECKNGCKFQILGEDVVRLLNEQDEKNIEVSTKCSQLEKENEQLRKDIARYRRNFREMEDVKCELAEENNEIKSILLKKVEELNDAYNKSAKAGMPTGGIIGELDTLEEICEIMGWIE